MNKFFKRFMLLSSLSFLASCGGEKPMENNDNKPKPIPEDEKVHLVLLAGQSGARGKALNTDLTEIEQRENRDIQILADGLRMEHLGNIPHTPNNKARFENTAPGFGDSNTEFGPEIGIANVLKARYPKTEEGDPRAAIVKYSACGSTFMDDWMSESTVADESITINRDKIITNEELGKEVGPLTNNFYQMIDKAKTFYDDLGYETVVDGVIFVHGEQDTKFDANMEIYEKALTNFIKDTRNYLGDEKTPFIITEALTNSGKYTNKLREIQKRVALNNDCIFMPTKDLETNSFEPWHFNARSNVILGERCAAELVKFKDNRVITGFKDKNLVIEANNINAIPKYLTATFEDENEAIVPVTFDEFDNSKSGSLDVKVKTEYNTHIFEETLKVEVVETPYVDGNINEPAYKNAKANKVGDNMEVKFIKGEDGIYVGATVKDNQIYTDGEAWHTGDMGQMNQNDDLELFIDSSTKNSGEASDRYSVFLSSANLLRVYDKGVDTSRDDSKLSSKNLYNKKVISGFKHSVTTKNTVNDGTLTSMDMELFIPYEALGIEDTESIKIFVKYRDVNANEKGSKVTSNAYLAGEKTLTGEFEKQLENYFSINELI